MPCDFIKYSKSGKQSRNKNKADGYKKISVFLINPKRYKKIAKKLTEKATEEKSESSALFDEDDED